MKENKIITYLGILTIFFEIVKLFYGYGWLLQGVPFAMLWTVMYFFFFIKGQFQRWIILFFLFFIIALLHYSMGSTGSRINTFSDMLYLLNNLLFPLLFFDYFARCVNIKVTRFLVVMMSVIFVFYALRLLSLSSGNLYFLRQAMTDMATINFYRSIGLPDYSLTHAIIFISPVLVFLLKTKHKYSVRFFSLLLLVASFILVYWGGSTTPLILFVFLLLISFVWSKRNSYVQNIFLCVFFFIPVVFLLNDSIMLGLLDNLSGIVDASSPLHRKIDDMEDSILYDQLEGDLGVRSSLYGLSFETFISHPLWGTLDGEQIGGHSYFLDMFASLGLFGGLFLLWYVIDIIKYMSSFITGDVRAFYFMGIASFFIMGCIKSFSGNDFFVIPFIYLPLLCLCIGGGQMKENEYV